MSVFLVSLSMLFATLILGFIVFRLSSDSWPPMGMERPSLFYPLLSTAFIVVSSLTLEVYIASFKQGIVGKARTFLGLTLGLGVGFLGAQFLLWEHLKSAGYVVDTGVFASMLHSFTWVHAAHIVMGVAWLLYLIPTVSSSAQRHTFEVRVTSAAKFWHFLDIVWLLLFAILFVF